MFCRPAPFSGPLRGKVIKDSYITETTNGKEFTTKNKTLSPEPEDSGEEDTKYRLPDQQCVLFLHIYLISAPLFAVQILHIRSLWMQRRHKLEFF